MKLKWTNDRAMAECPFCGSVDVGAAGGRAHCYKCCVTITCNSFKEVLTAWNTRGGMLQKPEDPVSLQMEEAWKFLDGERMLKWQDYSPVPKTAKPKIVYE